MNTSAEFTCNLRLWSDDSELITISESLDLPREHFHYKGKPIRFDGVLQDRIAKRHYVSFVGRTTNSWLEAERATSEIIRLIAEKRWFSEFVSAENIEATIWISITGSIVTPIVSRELITKASTLGLSIHIDQPLASS